MVKTVLEWRSDADLGIGCGGERSGTEALGGVILIWVIGMVGIEGGFGWSGSVLVWWLSCWIMVTVTVSQYLLQVVSLMMVGHLGILVSFSGVAIATFFAEVTGFSVLLGMAGALETLCGQTYGADEFRKLRNYTCCAIITLILICLPMSLLWTFTDKILLLFSQDLEISHAACEYSIYLIPALFGYVVLQSLIRYFQTHSMIFLMVLSSIVVLCLHVPICWVLVFKLGLGHVGETLAIGISYWLNVIGLGIYIKYSYWLWCICITYY